MLDIDAAVDRFRDGLTREARRMALTHLGIVPRLRVRREQARIVDESTRDFPIVRFFNEAVTMSIAPGQHGLLAASSAPPSLGAQFLRGGARLVDGLTHAWAPLGGRGQARFVGRFAEGLDRMLGAVVASMERFETPSPAMFDPTGRSAGDLFGLAGMAFRALSEASEVGGEIDRFRERLRGTLHILGHTPADEVPASRSLVDTGSWQQPLSETFDVIGMQLLGAVTILAALPKVVDVLLRVTWLRIQLKVLEALETAERHVLELRRSILEAAFFGLTGWADRMLDLAAGAFDIVGQNVRFFLRLWQTIATEFGDGIRTFAIDLTGFLRDVVALIRAIPSVIDALVHFDLTKLITSAIGRAVPTFTLSDLLDRDARNVNVALKRKLEAIIVAARIALERANTHLGPVGQIVTGKYVAYARRQLRRAMWLVQELFPGGGAVFPAEPPPMPRIPDFPDLYQTLFGGGRAARLASAIDRLGTVAADGLQRAARRSMRGLGELGDAIARDTAGAAHIREDRLDRVAQGADTLADRLVGPQLEAERSRRSPNDIVAQAFESWFASTGFELVARVIPDYAAELAAHWRAQIAGGEEPMPLVTATSPRLLAQRAIVGRVAMPRMTLRARAAELDQALAAEVARQFAAGVTQAYQSGTRQLQVYAGAA
jgi:hypothetical protein